MYYALKRHLKAFWAFRGDEILESEGMSQDSEEGYLFGK